MLCQVGQVISSNDLLDQITPGLFRLGQFRLGSFSLGHFTSGYIWLGQVKSGYGRLCHVICVRFVCPD
jgi:hypothetical protein